MAQVGNVSQLYYAVEDLNTGEVVRRGTAPSTGIPRNGLILANNTNYREWLFDPARNLIGFVDFTTPSAGFRFDIPKVPLRLPRTPDTDGDGLSNDAEFILGTNPTKADTDGDGINDSAALQLGLDPAAGARTGVVGSADTPGSAMDVCSLNDIVVVADGSSGVSVFNVFNRMAPLIIAQVNTPGMAQRVACSGNLIAVADGAEGLAVIDISDPALAGLLHEVPLGGNAQAVATAGDVAYVGLSEGQIVAVDLQGGSVLERTNLGVPIHDLGVEGEMLFALSDLRLYAYQFTASGLVFAGSIVTSSSPADALTGFKRLFVGGGHAYVASSPGYDVIDTRNPASMLLVGRAQGGGPGSFKQIVLNGSGMGVAAVGVNPRDDGTHDIYLYDVSDSTVTTGFVTSLVTPNIARAVSLYNGLAYVADSAAGLHVVNYVTTDTKGISPAISIATSAGANGIEEGQSVRVTAQVSDDVQVRNVEFYLDGAKAGTDGNFPFEYRFNAPLRTTQKNTFVLSARASDTGGNAAWSALLTLSLRPDRTPPRLAKTFPAHGSWIGSVDALVLYFNEAIDPASLNENWFSLVAAGTDQVLGTGDDVAVSPAGVSYREDLHAIVVSLVGPLAADFHRATAGLPLRDLAGNTLSPPVSWYFHILGPPDADHDGVPDAVEGVIGTNAANSDTDLDGIPDGDEDADNDGLSNAGEVRAGTAPTRADSNGNGVPDRDEDPDRDSFSNRAEALAGTNPLRSDTDGDNWDDNAEATALSDPSDPSQRPIPFTVSNPVSVFTAATPVNSSGEALGVHAGWPPLSIFTPALAVDGNNAVKGVWPGHPPVILQGSNQ